MFSKWDIVYISRFPETIKCTNIICNRHFSIQYYACPHCGTSNNVTNFIAKIRPVIMWHDQSKWFKSMTFAIPLSTSNMYVDRYNEIIKLTDYSFIHRNPMYQRPMRAAIHQSTRVDGNVCQKKKIIGKITNSSVQTSIENKLFEWLFGS